MHLLHFIIVLYISIPNSFKLSVCVWEYSYYEYVQNITFSEQVLICSLLQHLQPWQTCKTCSDWLVTQGCHV